MNEHLDASTPWHSHAEQIAARSERDHLGRNRYENDPSHREAWDAKTGLGYRVGGGVSVNPNPGAAQSSTGADLSGGSMTLAEGEFERFQRQIEVDRQAESQRALAADAERLQQNAAQIPDRETLTVSAAVAPFATRSEMLKYTTHERYRNDADFRGWVEKRIMASDFSGVTE